MFITLLHINLSHFHHITDCAVLSEVISVYFHELELFNGNAVDSSVKIQNQMHPPIYALQLKQANDRNNEIFV